jgi:NADP-dependent 3-hydroxy acid dehydrogenase YdfG
MAKLKNQIAVITGASSGIGKAIALGLTAQGVKLCLIGRNLKTLEAVTESAKSKASQVKTYKVDLNVDDDIQKLKQSLQQDFGYIDMLIHSAGVFSMGMLENSSIEDFDMQYRINVRAPYLLTQELLPMIKTRCGQIVFINSSVGLNAKGGVSQYAATKHALKAIADSLRAEINDSGVRVLSIYPGRTATPMQKLIHKMEGRKYNPELLMQPKDVAEVVINAICLPRTAEVTDIHIRPFSKLM